MDLKDLDTTQGAEQGFELELLHPVNAAPLGIFITVLGRDSAAHAKLQNEQNRRRINRAQKLGNKPTLSLEELERDAIELYATCTSSWHCVEKDGSKKPTLLVDGKELECVHENAVKLYTRFKWVCEQVDTAIVDRANFLKR